VTNPSSLEGIDPNKERNEKCKLHIGFNGPRPVEATFIWSLEVGIDVTDEEYLSPPSSLARLKHHGTVIPNGTGTQARE
jgi:hypothetical protein